MDFSNRIEVIEHLKDDFESTNCNFLNTDIPFPTDKESYQQFIHTIKFMDSTITDYERTRKE